MDGRKGGRPGIAGSCLASVQVRPPPRGPKPLPESPPNAPPPCALSPGRPGATSPCIRHEDFQEDHARSADLRAASRGNTPVTPRQGCAAGGWVAAPPAPQPLPKNRPGERPPETPASYPLSQLRLGCQLMLNPPVMQSREGKMRTRGPKPKPRCSRNPCAACEAERTSWPALRTRKGGTDLWGVRNWSRDHKVGIYLQVSRNGQLR